MQKTTRRLTTIEWMTLAVALIVGITVAIYFGNLIAAIAIAVTLAAIGTGFLYVRR